MHELSLVRAIAARVARDAMQRGLRRVSVVQLEVGVLTATLPEALRFAWQSLLSAEEGDDDPVKDMLGGSRLDVEIVPVVTLCPACGDRWEQQKGPGAELLWFPELGHCRRCGGGPLQLQSGLDVFIKGYAGE